ATAFARSLAEKSPGPDAQLLEARSLVAAGRGSDAAAVIASALGSSTDNGQRSELYLLRSHTGTTDPSDDLRLSLLENPDNLEALTALADLLATQGNLRKALEYARHAADIAPDDPTVSERVRDFQTRAAGN
ncbi:MAG TPA: tetratricopeptide repeat protein, partial [Spirochaetia bacterium]